MIISQAGSAWQKALGCGSSEKNTTQNTGRMDFNTLLNISLEGADLDEEDISREVELAKEVGFYRCQMIMKTVQRIEKVLKKAKEDFPAYQDCLEGIEDLFADRLPRSIPEALLALSKALDGPHVPDDIATEFKARVFQLLDEAENKIEAAFECKLDGLLADPSDIGAGELYLSPDQATAAEKSKAPSAAVKGNPH